MFTARCVVTFVLFAFSFVVLCATEVCGKYSAGVLRGGDVGADKPKYIYAAGKRRWQMRAILQSREEAGEDHVTQVVQRDGENVSPPDSETKLTDTPEEVTKQATDRDGVVRGDNEPATVPPSPGSAGDLESTSSTGHTLPGSVPAGFAGGDGVGGVDRGGSSSGGTSPGSDSTKSRLPGPESPREAAPTTRENDQGGGPASTGDAQNGNQETSGAAGNGGGNSGTGSTRAAEKKDDPQKTKGDKQSNTTPQPPTTAPSSTGENTATSSTVSETTSDAANIGITAPVLGALVFLFLLPLTVQLIVLP